MTIKWGILGAGRIAEKFAADFSEVENGEIVAVASRSIQKADAFAQKFKIKNAYGSYDDLVKDENIDVIYVATTHNFHMEHSMLCLRNQKHVLCEKPIGVNKKQLELLIQEARQNNLFLMEAMWTHFLPPIKKAMDWLSQGLIGDVTLVQANFGFAGNKDPKARLYNPELAGGSLLDIGIYPITIADMVAKSEVVDVKASAVISSTGVDETLSLQFTFKNGILAQLSSSFALNMKSDAYIYGTKGMIHIPKFWMCDKVYLKTDTTEESFIDNRNTLGYNFEVDAVNEMLMMKQAECPLMPLSNSLRITGLMDDIRNKIGIKYPFE